MIDATSDDEHNQIFLEQLNELLQNDEGFEIIPDRERRSIDDQAFIVDGSGDFSDEEIPPVFTNLSIVAITMVRTFLLNILRQSIKDEIPQIN